MSGGAAAAWLERRSEWATRATCPNCGQDLRKERFVDMTKTFGNGQTKWAWRPVAGSYVEHQPACPQLCNFDGCFAPTPNAEATCADHDPERMAELARLEQALAEERRQRAEREAELSDRRRRRQLRAATGTRRRELKADYNKPVTVRTLLNLKVSESLALGMVARALVELEDQ